MRTRVSLVVSAIVLMLGVVSIAQPAGAAPAETYTTPFSYNECSPPGPVVYCYQGHGVIHYTVTPSGNQTFVDNREECSQISRNGVTLQERCDSRHYVVHMKGNEAQVVVLRGMSEQSYVISGTTYTCSGSYNAIYANGEVRHDAYQFQCTPPL